VTNSHEPSYYEIALTNRQVVVAFVILLICLVSAFFSGLWIGRESAARSQEQIVRNTPPTPAEPQEGQALEEFRFFEDDQQKGTAGSTPAPAAASPTPQQTPQKAASTAAEDTTLLEDFGGGGDEEAVADPDLPEGRRRRGRGAGAGAAGTEGDEETVATQPTPAPSPSPTPARPQRTVPAEPRLGAGQMVIQVFSTADVDQAESVRGRLTKGGHKAYLSPVQVGGRTMYRVRIGPFDSRDQAQKVAEQVRKGYKLDTWVTE
jgi:DedD protein